MADLKTQFDKALRDVRKLKKMPSNGDLLALYSLYKQGSAGDVSGSRPGLLDLRGRAKYDAWAKLKGLGREEAMTRYVAKVEALLAAG